MNDKLLALARTLIPGPLRRRLAPWRRALRLWRRLNSVDLTELTESERGRLAGNIVAEHPRGALQLTNERVMAYAFYSRLRKVVELANLDLIIDAGAHEGQFGGMIKGYCETPLPMISFEPVKQFHANLCLNAALYPNWDVENLALGDVEGPTSIHVGGNHGGTSSILAQTEYLTRLIPDAQLGESQPIMVRRLDSYLAERFGAAVPASIFLKLDVQGFEEQVFRSAGRFTNNITLLLAELSSVPFYEGQKRFGEMCSFFADAGFAPMLIHNNYGYGGIVYFDFDVLFCRTQSLESLAHAAA